MVDLATPYFFASIDMDIVRGTYSSLIVCAICRLSFAVLSFGM